MEFRGYRVQVESVTVAGRTYEMLMPDNCEALLDDPRVVTRFEHDEYMPYWAILWPGALVLADAVAQWPSLADAAPLEVLELGCGLGLVGLVASGLGFRVTISDYDEDAVAFAQVNAARNGLPEPVVRVIDWRLAYDDLRCDRILAADVLYEARHLEPVSRFIQVHLRPGGLALLSDANRSTADIFPAVARAHGLSVATTPVERPGGGAAPVVRARIFTVRAERPAAPRGRAVV